MARHSSYTPEIVEKVKEYINSCKDTYDPETKRLKVSLPSIEGLAIYLGINRDTVYAWRKEFSEFSDSIEDLLNSQAQVLLNNGLAGTYNPTIAKVILSQRGYREATEQDVTSGGDKIQGVVVLPSKNENTLESTTQTTNSPTV